MVRNRFLRRTPIALPRASLLARVVCHRGRAGVVGGVRDDGILFQDDLLKMVILFFSSSLNHQMDG